VNPTKDKIPYLVKDLYAIVEALEQLFPGRKFTPDGHLVGSIGEVLAAYDYGLKLLPNSAKTHDAITPDGKMVQIKATQIESIALSSQPDYLIVLKLHKNGIHQEVYNGPGAPVWNRVGKLQKNGQRRIGLQKLRELTTAVEPANRLAKVSP
jgi:hypothetical protein